MKDKCFVTYSSLFAWEITFIIIWDQKQGSYQTCTHSRLQLSISWCSHTHNWLPSVIWIPWKLYQQSFRIRLNLLTQMALYRANFGFLHRHITRTFVMISFRFSHDNMNTHAQAHTFHPKSPTSSLSSLSHDYVRGHFKWLHTQQLQLP